MARALPWLRVEAPDQPITGHSPAVVLVDRVLAPGDWVELRERWPDSWMVREPAQADPEPVEAPDFQAALGRAPLACFALGVDGRALWQNAAATELLGEVSRSTVARAGQDGCFGNRALLDKGEVAPVEVQAWRLRRDGSDILMVSVQDARPALTAASLENRGAAYHRALVENARDAIAIVEPDGRVRYQSPAVKALLGFEPQDVEGRPLQCAFAEDRQRLGRALERARAAPGRSVQVVYRQYDADGELHWLESVVTNQLDDPLVAGLVVNSRDITAQRSLERGLRETERLRVAGLLAATVAHDLNNMISVVQVGLEAVEQGTQSREQLDAMAGALQRSSDLARRLTAFGRRGAGEVRRIDLGQLVGHVEPLLRSMLPEGITLALEVAPGEHPVRVEVRDLEQALVNLVANARDATAPQGHIDVHVQRRPGGPRPRVVLSVGDDGTGMDPETRARLFQPYFTTKGPDKGTGLGLVMVRSVVEECGGEVELHSVPGEGTRFDLVLPIDTDTYEVDLGGA